MIISYIIQVNAWNNGKCPKCDVAWEYFDMSLNGSRGYMCPKCNRTLWIADDNMDGFGL